MRIVVFILLSLLILTIATTIVFAQSNTNSNDIIFIEVTVKEGDTLWNIAKKYYDGKSDFRDLIYKIRKLNDLEQAIIFPGQKIIIPVS